MEHNGGNKKPSVVRVELQAQQLKNVAGAFHGVSGTCREDRKVNNSQNASLSTDPFAVVTLLSNNPNEEPRVIGKTEVIQNSLSPRWTTKFDVPYELGTNVRINVGIWDEATKTPNKPMGSAMFEVGEVLGSKGNTKAKKLRHGGTIFCRITPAPQDMGVLKLQLVGQGFKNVEGLFGKADPFFEISSKVMSAGGLTWQAVYRSNPIQNDLNPKWEMAVLDLARLTPDGDLDQPMLVEVWDWNKHGKHTPMGRFECSVGSLISSAGSTVGFKMMRSSKEFGTILVLSAELEGYDTKNQGRVITGMAPSAPVALPSFSNLNIQEQAPLPPPMLPPPMLPPCIPMTQHYHQQQQGYITPRKPSFVEYLTGGLELELAIAVDFTGSNGDPRQPGTLHYIHPDGQLNDYEKAITAVGGIIGRYDSDQKFPVFGFGAKYSGVVQHCFQLGDSPELDGLSSVLQAYRDVFSSGLVMSGPTVFSEVIDYTAAIARSRHEALQRIGHQSYKILLILTDGAVTDVEATKQSIRNAADAPMSIVIVGVGSADFQAMRDLDDFLKHSPDLRDIVQFVEFAQHAHNRQSLTSATLEEIPNQLVDFFYSRGIPPLPPVSGSQINLIADEATDEDVDLNLAIHANGEISWLNTAGAVYDDTKYHTRLDYSAITPLAAPVPPRMFQVRVPNGVYDPSHQSNDTTTNDRHGSADRVSI